MEHNNNVDLSGSVIGGLAAASKAPFKTAFLATMGVGVGRLVLFSMGLGVLIIAYKLVS